jgi:hypothetical protein
VVVFKVLALINVFLVPKGNNDICMVYDGTKSGLNDMLFCPWVWLPMMTTMTRTLHKESGTGDNDLGDFFLNFWQHQDLVPFLGVDLTHTFFEEATGAEKLLVAWVRCTMGLKPSPYYAVQCGNQAKQICLGSPKLEYLGLDPTIPKNQFHWDHVRMNGCPGNACYDSTFPWMAKIRMDEKIATDIHQYIDDNRTTAPTVDKAWLAGSQWAKRCSYLGIQDASWKRREASKKGGAWVGGVAHCDEQGVWKLITQERWDKTKSKLATLDEVLKNVEDPNTPAKELDRKLLERIRGFLFTWPKHTPWCVHS